MRTTAVVIGAGHSGLAVSRRLTERSIDHVVIERGEVANSWRTERWDSLRLLTPNWLTNLPGLDYMGTQPDGYMTAGELATHLGGYAATIDAPVQSHTTVEQVRAGPGGYEVVTDRGPVRCASVVIASGPCNKAQVPAAAASLPPAVDVRTPLDYRSPEELGEGGVLVVGASATGVQLAEEIHRSGRPVTLAVGEHVRMPRTYRGRDIFWWTHVANVLDERYDELDDLVRARRLPSPQLIGSPDRRSVDLNHLAGAGITIVGRLGRITGERAQFSGSLTNTCALADLKMNRLLDRLDAWAERTDADVDPPERFGSTQLAKPPLEVDLRRSGITTVLFATGFRPDHPWLDLPVFDRRKRIVHDGGVITGAPGCYVVGLNVLRRRRSSYISGAERDSADIARLLHHHLDLAASSPGLLGAGDVDGVRRFTAGVEVGEGDDVCLA